MNERDLFIAVLHQRDPAKRAALLHRHCAGDQALRDRVEELLREQEHLGSFLERPAEGPGQTGAYTPPGGEAATDLPEKPGTVVGPYKLLEPIGEGGFGVVFMAEQQEPIRRRVALKILKPGMDTRQVVARFEAERQALALMDHPNIARVFDGGATASGRPYFVMELVKGVPITDFCDQIRMPVRERLELFVSVCQAVQHAHQKGIIHRDLKPSNVLVTLQDGTPVAKVIDFGIAKATGQQLTDKTLFTHFQAMMGTPLYMSPEQAGMSGLDADTRSDVYSLGVMLYELLTGTTPFDKERLKAVSYDEMRRIIREEEPPRPSLRLSTIGQASTTLSTHRQSDPRRLSSLLRGELDWIVMKALEKDRNRRYETATGFAADVRRYLAGEPVQAVPPSVGYRLRRFARQNRGRLAAVGVLGVAVLVAGAGIGWALRDRDARQAQTERERTGRLARTEQAVNQAVDQAAQHRAKLHAELRDKGTRALLNQPERWRAQIRDSRSELERARALSNTAEGPLAVGLSGRMQALARELADDEGDYRLALRLEKIREDRSAWVGGNFDYGLAAKQYPEAFQSAGLPVAPGKVEELATRIARSPIRDQLLAALDDWALVTWFMGQRDLPRRLLQAARQADPDPEWNDQLRDPARWADPKALKAVADRGLATPALMARLSPQMLTLLGVLLPEGEREEWLRQAQTLHPTDYWLNFDLGLTVYKASPARAEGFYRAALAIRPTSTAAWTNLGVTLFQQKELDRALTIYNKVLALDPAHEIAWANRDKVYRQLKQTKASVGVYSKAVRLQPDNAVAWYYLGTAHKDLHQFDRVVADCTKALDLKPDYHQAWFLRGNAHTFLGDSQSEANAKRKLFELAIADYSKALALRPDRRELWLFRAFTHRRLKRWDKAIADLAKHLEFGPNPKDVTYGVDRFAIRLGMLASWLIACPDHKLRDPRRALQLTKKAMEYLPTEAALWTILGVVHYRAGDYKEAVAALDKSMELGKGGDGFDWFALAMVQWRLGNKEVAHQWYDKAAVWMDKNKPNDDLLREYRAEAAALLGVANRGRVEVAPLPRVKK